MNINMPDFNSTTLEEEMLAILESDRELLVRLHLVMQFLPPPEKLAAGLHAYWLIDTSETQLCSLTPKNGKFSTELSTAIDLIEKLSPQAKAEFANDILIE